MATDDNNNTEATREGIPEKTELMRQHRRFKEKYPDAILLFRVGDFYETFREDAIKTSGILNITLTKRGNGSADDVPLAGFPYHALETYLPKLVRAGERVAICEQFGDPKAKSQKEVMTRRVTELVTPGISMSDNVLHGKENTFLGAVYFGKRRTGLAVVDASTGEFYIAEGDDGYIDKLLANLAPKEVLHRRGDSERYRAAFGGRYYTYKLDDWAFSARGGEEKLCELFGVKSLKGFGVAEMADGIAAAGAVLQYLKDTEHKDLAHITSITRIAEDEFVWVDRFTIRNLELFGTLSGEGRGFLGVVDRTSTPMGGRLLRHWIALPLKDIEELRRRYDVVDRFRNDGEIREQVAGFLSVTGDLERISSRIATGRVNPRELVQLKDSLDALEKLSAVLRGAGTPLAELMEGVALCREAADRIRREIYPDPANNIAKGGVIADCVDAELDDARQTKSNARVRMAEILERETQATGIPSLRIGFNNVFGHYIEVRNTHRDKVPVEWRRKQTLTGAERYVTDDLIELEEKISTADGRAQDAETRIYEALVAELAGSIGKFQRGAAAVARIDCLLCFATVAIERSYCRPELSDDHTIDIRDGRHPVIETLMEPGQQYVPNDVLLDGEVQQIMMITGPNMAGKSAFLRQTALIVLMAQMGSFVPASSAHIGIVDKIFTRVGASDNISQGESTFMVEMLESAAIMNNLSDRSLVLLDEIGRGTSTYDGMSIAWAMVEHIHNHPTARARTMFATHYHELNELEELLPRVKNYNVAVREVNRTILFLRKLVRGGTEHSFGIHVAGMAGMPASIVERAGRLLASLEEGRAGEGVAGAPRNTSGAGAAGNVARSRAGTSATPNPSQGPRAAGGGRQINTQARPQTEQGPQAEHGGVQLSMFQLEDPVLIQIRDQIRGLNINSLTPIQALNILNDIKKVTGI